MSSNLSDSIGELLKQGLGGKQASGKWDEGGETNPPFGLAAGELVSVSLVDADAFGHEVCGGRIGMSGATFCMQDPTDCVISAHSKKVELEQGRAGSQALVIRTSGKDLKAFTSPVLDASAIPEDHLSGMLDEARPVEEWKQLFTSIKMRPDSKRAPAKVGFSTALAYTPRKEKHRYIDEEDADSPFAHVDLPDTEDFQWPDSPPDEQGWSTVTAHMTALKDGVTNLGSKFTKLSLQVGGDVDRVEAVVDAERRKSQVAIGNRPGIFGSSSVWDALATQYHSINAVTLPDDYCSVQDAKKQAESTMLDALRDQIIPFVQKAIERVQVSRGTDGLSRGNDDDEDVDHVKLSRAAYNELQESHKKLSALVISVERLREEMSVATVTMGALTFNSTHDCQVFLEKHNGHDSVIKMFDIVSLLQASCFGNEGTKESLDFDQKASKSSYKSAAEAIYVKSFGLSLPEIFGKVDTAKTAAQRGLPGVKTFRDWDAQCEQDGLVHYIQDGVNKFIRATTQELSDSFSLIPPELRALALFMLTTTHTWLIAWVGWVTKYYHDLVNGGESTPDEVWSHVSAVLRVMFRTISLVRTNCSTRIDGSFDSKRRAPALMWGTLQAHLKMQEFSDMQFQNHPSVAPVLTRHLFAHRQSKIAAKATDDRVKSLESSVKNLKSTIDKKPWKS